MENEEQSTDPSLKLTGNNGTKTTDEFIKSFNQLPDKEKLSRAGILSQFEALKMTNTEEQQEKKGVKR